MDGSTFFVVKNFVRACDKKSKKMKTKKILLVVVTTVLTLTMQSCYSTSTLTQRVSYRVTNEDGDGRTDQNQFSVQYDKFTITYSADGGCVVKNNSDSMMYIDMGESYFMRRDGDAIRLYDNSIRTNSSTTAVGVSGTQYDYNTSGTVAVAGSNTNVVQTQEERIVTIPPHGRKQLKFYSLPFLNTMELVNGKEVYKSVGTVNNYTNEFTDINGHVMTYSFSPQVYKKMARNNFSITKEEIMSSPSSTQDNSIRQRSYEVKIFNKTKTIITSVIYPVILGTLLILSNSGALG